MTGQRVEGSANRRIGELYHLDEEQAHRYLDGELTDVEYAEVAAHLTACDACRAELAALQRLFLALDELAPAPDLAPALRVRLAAARPAAPWRRWAVPALQVAAVVALLAWAATRPYACWPYAAQTLQRAARALGENLSAGAAGLAAGLPRWMVDLPGSVSSWPAAAWGAAQGWAARLAAGEGPALASSCIVVLAAVLVVMGLVGNWVLLRRAALNGPMVS